MGYDVEADEVVEWVTTMDHQAQGAQLAQLTRLADYLPIEMEQVPERPARSPGPSPLRPGRGCPLGLPLLATWPGSMPLRPARPGPSLLLLAQ